tara:strand:+ start:852 stop:1451 length:600 start_codon:yes stop_codon:yes gene_type:complete
MKLKLYHQFKTLKVLLGITIIFLAFYNFINIDYDNKFTYLVDYNEDRENALIIQKKNEFKADDLNIEFFKKFTEKIYYYQNINSNFYSINFKNNTLYIERIQPKYRQEFYNPYDQKIINLQKNYQRELTKEEISNLLPYKYFSSFIIFKSQKIDKELSKHTKINSFIEMQDQYFLNNLILLILVILVSIIFIFLTLSKK